MMGKGVQRVTKAKLILLRNSFTSASALRQLPAPRAVRQDGLQDLWPCCWAELLLPWHRHRPRPDGKPKIQRQNPMGLMDPPSAFFSTAKLRPRCNQSTAPLCQHRRTPSGPSARYCLYRGRTGQVTVVGFQAWSWCHLRQVLLAASA